MNKKQLFYKTISVFAVIIAFSFSNNVNAISTSLTPLSSSTTALSINTIALTTGHWKRNRNHNHRNRNRCSRCRRQHSGSRCGGGGDKIPLDGGLSILAIGAAAFGFRKLRGNNKNDKS